MAKARSSSRNTDENTRFWEKISLVAEINALCRDRQPSPETYREVLTLISHILPFDGATLFLWDKKKKRLVEATSLNQKVEMLGFLTINQGDGLTGWTAMNKKPVLISGRKATDNFEPGVDFGTILGVPLLVEDTVLGVLNLGCKHKGAFQEKDVKLMTVVADQMAVSLERMFYRQEIELKNQILKKAHRELKVAQEQLVAQEKLAAVVELARSINHEINNPLAVIVGNIQCLLLEEKNYNQKTLSRLKRVEGAAMKISEINKKILKINNLVSENYLNTDPTRILNLEESIKDTKIDGRSSKDE